jgi:hypothetical protein
VEEEDRLAKLEEEINPMKALENRTADSKREMDILDALQDLRARNARNERVGHSVDLMERIGLEEVEDEEDKERKRLEEDDEKLVREVFSKVTVPGPSSMPTAATGRSSTVTVKRKVEDTEPDLESLLPESTRVLITSKTGTSQVAKRPKSESKSVLGVKVTKKRKPLGRD